jgi:hypothetical protein
MKASRFSIPVYTLPLFGRTAEPTTNKTKAPATWQSVVHWGCSTSRHTAVLCPACAAATANTAAAHVTCAEHGDPMSRRVRRVRLAPRPRTEEESAVHELIASQSLDEYLLLRPGSPSGIKIGSRRHRELEQAAAKLCPTWLVDAVRQRWPDPDLTDRHGHGHALWRAAQRWGAHHHAEYQLLQARFRATSEHLFLPDGLRSIGSAATAAA